MFYESVSNHRKSLKSNVYRNIDTVTAVFECSYHYFSAFQLERLFGLVP